MAQRGGRGGARGHGLPTADPPRYTPAVPPAPLPPHLPAPLVVAREPAWLALSKPAGLPVFPPHDDPGGDCVLARLLREEPAQDRPDWPAGFEGGIAHRLDTATSGLLLAAASPEALATLRARFASHQLVKRYLLLSWRDVPWDHHEVVAPLAHDARRKARMVVQRGRDTPHRGRWLPARTSFTRRGGLSLPEGGLALFEARMQTGVMHQIRAHAAFAGLALAGDGLYGGGAPTPAAQAFAREAGLAAPPFHLHHLGLSGPDLCPPELPAPAWWPVGSARW